MSRAASAGSRSPLASASRVVTVPPLQLDPMESAIGLYEGGAYFDNGSAGAAIAAIVGIGSGVLTLAACYRPPAKES